MNDSMDGYVRQALKNWAVEQQPPANGRARLLLLAASPSAQRAILREPTCLIPGAHPKS